VRKPDKFTCKSSAARICRFVSALGFKMEQRPKADPTNEFNLASIRDALIRQEETIIFALIERGQFAQNSRVYARGPGVSLAPESDAQDSFFEYFLYQTEILHAKLGRYRAGDLEHAFFAKRGLPEAHLSHTPAEPWGKPLKANEVNLNDLILKRYPTEVARRVGHGEDDKHYGSTCVCDIALIQALSYRIHYGKLVAESKFRAKPELFTALIIANDREGIMRELTDVEVEKQVIQRVRNKAARYARPDDNDTSSSAFKVDPDVIANLYGDFLIPMNKDVQVEYLMNRLS